jgi:hypothetical protein
LPSQSQEATLKKPKSQKTPAGKSPPSGGPVNADAELLAALEAVRGFLDRVVDTNERLLNEVRAGREVPPGRIAELEEQLAAERADLERFGLRVAQLKAAAADTLRGDNVEGSDLRAQEHRPVRRQRRSEIGGPTD